eukprot:scaffold38481_cov84-Phaeocystis_antarctica.AAC.5
MQPHKGPAAQSALLLGGVGGRRLGRLLLGRVRLLDGTPQHEDEGHLEHERHAEHDEHVHDAVIGGVKRLIREVQRVEHLRAGAAVAAERLRRVSTVEARGGACGGTLVGGDVVARHALEGAVVRRRRVEVVAKAVEEPAERHDVVEEAEGPDDVAAAEDEAAEDDGGRPVHEEGEHPEDGVGQRHDEQLRERLEHEEVARVLQHEGDEVVPRPAAHGEDQDVDGEAEGQQHRRLHDGRREGVRERAVHAVTDLVDDRSHLDGHPDDANDAEARRDAEDPPQVEEAEGHLLLRVLARCDVDQPEEGAHKGADDEARQVLQWVVDGQEQLAAKHHERLPARADGARLEHGGSHTRGRRLGRALGRGLPRVEHVGHGLLGGDVLGDEVEHGLSRVGLDGDRARRAVAVADAQRLADGGEVRRHVVARAAVSHTPLRQDEHLVEAREDGSRRLVDGAHDGGGALGGDRLEQRDDGGGGGRVEARGRLVEEEHARLLGERDAERETATLAAREPLEEKAARLGVLR